MSKDLDRAFTWGCGVTLGVIFVLIVLPVLSYFVCCGGFAMLMGVGGAVSATAESMKEAHRSEAEARAVAREKALAANEELDPIIVKYGKPDQDDFDSSKSMASDMMNRTLVYVNEDVRIEFSSDFAMTPRRWKLSSFRRHSTGDILSEHEADTRLESRRLRVRFPLSTDPAVILGEFRDDQALATKRYFGTTVTLLATAKYIVRQKGEKNNWLLFLDAAGNAVGQCVVPYENELPFLRYFIKPGNRSVRIRCHFVGYNPPPNESLTFDRPELIE